MAARILTPAPQECPEEVVQEACDLLQAGGLVALPTETVYGIAALADGGRGETRLAALKGRSRGEKELTFHIADREDASRLAPPLPRCAARLARRYWPGPLTLVVAGTDQESVGLRLPSRLITRAVIRAAWDRAPVVMSSANLPGRPPAGTAQEVMRELGEKVDLIIDGGPAELQEASTLVKAIAPRLELLRPGALSRGEVEATGCSLVIFVCTGNTCRSPMAAALARSLAAARLGLPPGEYTRSGLIFASAGISAMAGAPATSEALQAVAEKGADLSDHRSSPLTRPDLEQARFVFCLTRSHRELILARGGGDLEAKVMMLLPEGQDIPDPIGGDLDLYRNTRDRIEEALDARLASLLADPWEEES